MIGRRRPPVEQKVHSLDGSLFGALVAACFPQLANLTPVEVDTTDPISHCLLPRAHSRFLQHPNLWVVDKNVFVDKHTTIDDILCRASQGSVSVYRSLRRRFAQLRAAIATSTPGQPVRVSATSTAGDDTRIVREEIDLALSNILIRSEHLVAGLAMQKESDASFTTDDRSIALLAMFRQSCDDTARVIKRICSHYDIEVGNTINSICTKLQTQVARTRCHPTNVQLHIDLVQTHLPDFIRKMRDAAHLVVVAPSVSVRLDGREPFSKMSILDTNTFIQLLAE